MLDATKHAFGIGGKIGFGSNSRFNGDGLVMRSTLTQPIENEFVDALRLIDLLPV